MKTTQKWSKILLAGMAAMVLAFGLVLVGCDDGNGSNTGGNNTGGNTGGGGNPFVGTWTGNVTSGGGTASVTIVMTETTWSETATGAMTGTINGTYTRSDNTATLTKTGGSGILHNDVANGTVMTATVSGTNLTISGVTLTKS